MRLWAKSLVKDLLAKRGYRTSLHMVVIESDDWGAIRIPSTEALRQFRRKYPDYSLDRYQLWDGLETYDDVLDLSRLLLGFEKSFEFGPPLFTCNFATANPVFDGCSFENGDYRYEIELISTTYENYGETEILPYVRKGVEHTCLKPQLHGREHINMTSWLLDCAEQEQSRYAFELGMLGVNHYDKYASMDALNVNNILIDRAEYIRESQLNFEEIFGFPSDSFISPCYVSDDSCEEAARDAGVRVIQTGLFRNVPQRGGTRKRILTVFGEKSKAGQVRLVRNCQFEPAQGYFKGASADEYAEQCFADVEAAFLREQPAVLCSHRVNYVSRADLGHKDYSLESLDKLLTKISCKYPDTVFLTSDELGLRILAS